MNHQSIDSRARFADWGTLNHVDGEKNSGNRIGLENNLLSGIRNYEEVEEEMSRNGFQKYKDISMPANNKMLIFKKI